MNAFLEWFKPELKLKRWLFVILVGVAFVTYSLSTILAENTPKIGQIIIVASLFVVGFILIAYGIICLQKRTLEIFIEANGVNTKNLKEKNINMSSLIFDKNIYENGPNVVVIGGGSGLNTIISGVKKYTSNITAIVTLSDYKEDKSRKALNALPFVDIKESISSLAEEEEVVRKLLNLNFSSEKLRGLNFGDIYLLAMQEIYGNVATAIKKASSSLNTIGEVVPVSPDEITVCAELTDGTIVKTKEKIPKVVIEKVETIKRIYLNPTNVRVSPRAIEAIQEADLIIIGPGNLYTNIIPNLLVKNISKTIREAKGIKIYVANIMTDRGQTDGYTLSEHIKAIFDHSAGKVFDFCIADTGDIVPEYLRAYHKNSEDLVRVDAEEVKKMGVTLIERDLSTVSETGRIRHNQDAVSVAIMEILMDDIKHDLNSDKMQNTLLESVLKDQRKKEKRRSKSLNKAKNKNPNRPKTKSKFAEKYTERFDALKLNAKLREEQINKEKKEFFDQTEEKLKEKNKMLKDSTRIKTERDRIKQRAKSLIEEDININKAERETINHPKIESIEKEKLEKINAQRDLQKLKEAKRKEEIKLKAEKLRQELLKLEQFRMKTRKKIKEDEE